MAELFLSFWNRGMAAGWLILAALLVRLLWRKAPKSTRCLLWLLAGVRLLLPFSVESALSLVPSAEVIPQDALAGSSFRIDSGIHVLNSTVNEYLQSQYYEGAAVHHTRAVLTACGWVWLAGMAALLAWALVSWLRLRRQVAEAVPAGDGVWVCDAIASPFLLGLLRPRIYLPSGLPEEDRAFVTAHEKAHLRRRDHWTKPAAFLLLAAYWFHPLLWLAFVLLCRDIELACDERVVRELGPACKKAYSQALLRCSARRSAIAACPLAFGEAGVKERVKNVLNYKKPAFWAIAASFIVVAAAAVCFLTDPAAGTPDPQNASPSALNAAETEDTPDLGSPDSPPVYTGGALLYQNPALSSYFSDAGGVYASVQEDGDTLIIRDSSGTVTRFTLEEQREYTAAELYEELQFLSEVEEWMGRRLLPEKVSGIACRTYVSDELNADKVYARESIWEISLPDGGKRMWIGGNGRLFALIDLRKQFQFFADVTATWTYDPSAPAAIPVRFELDTVVSVSGGALSLDLNSQEWTGGPVSVAAGQTVYWLFDGPPGENTTLIYRYSRPDLEESDSISLRPAMDYEGLYGGRTYAISQDWLGLASSRFHDTWVRVDAESGALAVSFASSDPEDGISGLLTGWNGASVGGARIRDSIVWDAASGT